MPEPTEENTEPSEEIDYEEEEDFDNDCIHVPVPTPQKGCEWKPERDFDNCVSNYFCVPVEGDKETGKPKAIKLLCGLFATLWYVPKLHSN